jgi:glycosyltransferase involved in cell wall biosynthesis
VALPISAFIITRNEEARLPAALAALTDWIGEIIVVDSGSTDRTVDIAKAAGATVLHRKWTG